MLPTEQEELQSVGVLGDLGMRTLAYTQCLGDQILGVEETAFEKRLACCACRDQPLLGWLPQLGGEPAHRLELFEGAIAFAQLQESNRAGARGPLAPAHDRPPRLQLSGVPSPVRGARETFAGDSLAGMYALSA